MTHDKVEQSLLPVTAEDREAAWPHRPECYRGGGRTRENWDAGIYDHIPLLQAFARHRQSSNAAERGGVIARFARVASNIPDDVADDRTVCIEMPYKQDERVTGPRGETPLALVISLDGLTIGDFRALASLSTAMDEETRLKRAYSQGYDDGVEDTLTHGDTPHGDSKTEGWVNFRETLSPTPDRIGKDAVREALVSARHYVVEAVDAVGGIDACEIHMRHDLEAIDRALAATPAQPVDETERLRSLSGRAAPAPWVVYSEPEVGLFASVFSGTVGQTGFAPVNLDDPVNVEFIVEAVNFTRGAIADRAQEGEQ